MIGTRARWGPGTGSFGGMGSARVQFSDPELVRAGEHMRLRRVCGCSGLQLGLFEGPEPRFHVARWRQSVESSVSACLGVATSQCFRHPKALSPPHKM